MCETDHALERMFEGGNEAYLICTCELTDLVNWYCRDTL
jgi:hypothetical protein